MKISNVERAFRDAAANGIISKKEAGEINKLAESCRSREALLQGLVAKYAKTPAQEYKMKSVLGLNTGIVGPMDANLGKVSPTTHKALVKAYEAIKSNLGETTNALNNKSLTCVSDVLVKSLPGACGGSVVKAMIPVSTSIPPVDAKNPNNVGTFYIEILRGGVAPGISKEVYGPFELNKAKSTGPVSVHGIENGKTIEMTKGEKLTVALPENSGSTGLNWHLVNPNREFGGPTKEFFQVGGAPRAMGGGTDGGTQFFEFDTKKNSLLHAGETYPLRFELNRGSGKAYDKFTVKVKII